MRLLPVLFLPILSLARPDFNKAIPFFELNEHSASSGAYRHRASRVAEESGASTSVRPSSPITSETVTVVDTISEPLSRSEGWTGGGGVGGGGGGGRGLRKILIVKEKKRGQEKIQAQGIHIHSLPKGTRAVSLPEEEDEDNQSISELRKKFNVSLNSGDSLLPSSYLGSTKATEWPPLRSTLAPAGEFNSQTFRLLSGWLNSEKEKRTGQQKDEDEYREQKRLPLIRALARARPIVRIDEIADAPLPLSMTSLGTTRSPRIHSTTVRTARRHRKRTGAKKLPAPTKFREFSSMSFSPLEETPAVTTTTTTTTTTVPPPLDVETTEFVEHLAAKIEREESEVLKKRREHRKRNYGVNPLMYKVVDGVLYDRTGQPVRRVDSVQRDEPKRAKTLFGPAKNVDDIEIGHDEVSIQSTSSIFREATTPFPSTSPSSSFNLDESPLSLDPLPHPTAAMVSFPQSTTRFHFGKALHPTTPSPSAPHTGEARAPPPFPFVNCYMNADGFMCCNRELESALRSAYDSLPCRTGRVAGCSVQHVVKRVRNKVETRFGRSFEVVASLGDFAMYAHFADDLTCKIEKEGRFIAAYANGNDKPERNSRSSPSSSSLITDYMMLPRDRSIANPKDLTIKKKKTKKVVDSLTVPSPIPQPASRFNGGGKQATIAPQLSLDLTKSATQSTAIPNISLDFENSEQLDAPSIDVSKPDENFHRVVPFHERSRGKNDFAYQ